MLAFTNALHQEYCVRGVSQKRALMQRIAKALNRTSDSSAQLQDSDALLELLDVLKTSGHVLYRSGVDALKSCIGLDTPEAPYAESFEQMLKALLSDVLMFELMADHCAAALKGESELSAETLRCYTYSAMVCPALHNGSLVQDMRHSLMAAGAL